MQLNRGGIKKLMARGISRAELCRHFECSRPSFYRWIDEGGEPQAEAVTRFINDQIKYLLAKR